MDKFVKISGLLAFFLGLIAIVTLVLQGPGYQAGWWGLMPVFNIGFKIAVMGGAVAIVLGLLHIISALFTKKRVAILAIVGVLLGASAAAVPLKMKKIGKSVPAIHDITTDTKTPPAFVAIAPLRANASNPVTYDNQISQQQLKAYPDIKTLEIQASSSDVFAAALKVVDKLGWETVGSDKNEGRIEATETTTWFGFKDDVVIRIKQRGKNTFVDVRSKSRVGRSDLGANAARISKFIESLEKKF